MSLAHAILGFLSGSPLTGYDLKTNCFDVSVAHFWPADQAQIYRTLEKLTEQGLVDSRVEFQEDRPNRKVYSLTEAGRAELADWLRQPLAIPPYREPFLIQLFFAEQVPNERLITLMQNQIRQHESVVEGYQEIPLPNPAEHELTRSETLQSLTLDLGKRIEQTYIDWLNDSIETVRKMKP